MTKRFPFSVVIGCFIAMVLVFTIVAIAHAQSYPAHVQQDKNSRMVSPIGAAMLYYSPADLAMNAVTLPASAVTTDSTTVNMVGVTKATLFVNCTQSTSVAVKAFNEDGTTVFGTYTLFTAVAAGAQQIYFASELTPNATSGTTSAAFRLPQRAISINATNGTATPGTCTMRLAVGY